MLTTTPPRYRSGTPGALWLYDGVGADTRSRAVIHTDSSSMQFATILREEAKPAGKVKQTYVLNLKKALVNVRNVFPSHLHATPPPYTPRTSQTLSSAKC